MSVKIKLTAKDIKRYLQHAGMCPFCGSEDIVGDSIEVDGNCTWQEVKCSICDAEWRDVYTLSIMEVISGPTVEELSSSRKSKKNPGGNN